MTRFAEVVSSVFAAAFVLSLVLGLLSVSIAGANEPLTTIDCPVTANFCQDNDDLRCDEKSQCSVVEGYVCFCGFDKDNDDKCVCSL